MRRFQSLARALRVYAWVCYSLSILFVLTFFCGCSNTKGFLASDDFEMRDVSLSKKRYTEGFLDMTIFRKGSVFPSYKITSCRFTRSDMSSIVLERNISFAADDTVTILSRDGEELGSYNIHFVEEDTSMLGIVTDGMKVRAATATARLVIPYTVQTKYVKIGSKKLLIPDTDK
ncbi:MAG: hypothetical protein IKX90_01990 [Verrucomicrobia bacterium]|nr:hypothetical protein [Verrucomicrobiota bacterium]